MKLQYLEEIPNEWQKVLVIGKTIERDGKKYHIIGMSLGGEAKLYILEPFSEPKPYSRRKKHTHRQSLKENEETEFSYLHCREFCLGEKRLKIQGGCGGSLGFAEQDYRTISLFIDMMHAGWVIPDWLKNEDWDNLQLVTLTIADVKRLPKYSPEIPITLKHRSNPIQHIVEKTITLTVGKSRSFSFTDHHGDNVQCHINQVTLIDVWEDTEKQFKDPRYTKKLPPERLQEVKENCYKALEQNCPKGMCYIGIEYECTKDLSLQFYSKKYLRSYPESHHGSASFFLMHLKPDKKLGVHGLPLKGCAIQTAVSPDTCTIPAELFSYFEKVEEWEERI